MLCPRCQQTMVFDWSIGTMRCQRCDYLLFQEEAAQIRQQLQLASQPASQANGAQPAPQSTPTPAPAPTPEPDSDAPVAIEVPGGLNMSALPEHLSEIARVRMRGRLEAGMFALARNDREGARLAFRSALEISEDYTDAWVQLAALVDTRQEQRLCLENALASDRGNLVALKAMMKIDGDFEPSQPAAGPRLEQGQMAGEKLSCPQCGGRLTYDEATKEVFCAFCGYRVLDADDLNRSGEQRVLAASLLKRKYQRKQWNIGQRWLRCSSCGAITTLSRRTLTTTCRFCQSTHVVQENVNASFEQPDVIVPFTINEQNARAAIDEKLRSGIRVITRFFADAVDRIELWGVYLPFWVFDADMTVKWSWSNAPDKGDYPILLNEVPYLSAPTPDRSLADKIEPFDLIQGVDYDPRLLAAFPAQLYDREIDQASIDVRSKLGKLAMRQAEVSLRLRKPSGYGSDDDPGSLRMNARTDFLTYRFALLPVWVALLVEEDADSRQILVNGQTGKVALGKLVRAE